MAGSIRAHGSNWNLVDKSVVAVTLPYPGVLMLIRTDAGADDTRPLGEPAHGLPDVSDISCRRERVGPRPGQPPQ